MTFRAGTNSRLYHCCTEPIRGESPQFSSASASIYFQVNDEKNMSRRTYDASRNAGDTTEQTFYSEWMLVNGGAVGQRGTAGSRSELFSAYSTTLDADRSALPATDHALMLAQTDLEYEVTRVKSPVLGRDLNPMGRGDGAYYADGGNDAHEGSVAIDSAKPETVGETALGYGNNVNNVSGLSPGGGQSDPKLPCYKECRDWNNIISYLMTWNKWSFPDAYCRCCSCRIHKEQVDISDPDDADYICDCADVCVALWDKPRERMGSGLPYFPEREEGFPQRPIKSLQDCFQYVGWIVSLTTGAWWINLVDTITKFLPILMPRLPRPAVPPSVKPFGLIVGTASYAMPYEITRDSVFPQLPVWVALLTLSSYPTPEPYFNVRTPFRWRLLLGLANTLAVLAEAQTPSGRRKVKKVKFDPRMYGYDWCCRYRGQWGEWWRSG